LTSEGERIEQWPLTAAATQSLIDLPPSTSKGGHAPEASRYLKLAIKELILRGAFAVELDSRRFGKAKVALVPKDRPALPDSLALVDRYIRPHAPGDVATVLKNARRSDPVRAEEIDRAFLGELVAHGLAEEREDKVFVIFTARRWRRTVSGDAWAGDAERHIERFQALDAETGDPEGSARVAAEGGAIALLAPGALGNLARLQSRSRRDGVDYAAAWMFVPATGIAFDPIAGTGDLFDSALDGGVETLDASIGAVESAIDSVSSSIDSAVSSGVDSGGGFDGGGGGDSGGGGGGDGGGG